MSDRARSTQESLKRIIGMAYDASIASSISLFVGSGTTESDDDIVIHMGHCGHSQAIRTSDRSIYDLASITKVIGTTMAMAKHVVDGKFSLTENPIPAWPGTSISSLLSHTAGLEAHRHFCEELSLKPKDFLKNRRRILHELLQRQPRDLSRQRVYSDLGFMALGWVLESRLKKPLLEIFNDVWRTSGITPFCCFRSQPLSYQNPDVHLVPSGFCHSRKTGVIGQVHDANCYYLGGLSGHAGLFGDLRSVARAARFFLSAYKDPANAYEQSLQMMAKRGLGFDRPSKKGSTRDLSTESFGHFGYTGTSLWVDPGFSHDAGRIIVLLTNTTNCKKSRQGIYWLRRRVHLAAYTTSVAPYGCLFS